MAKETIPPKIDTSKLAKRIAVVASSKIDEPFERRFDIDKIDRLSASDMALFEKMKADIYEGLVFPSVRKDELHFYYKGGCLFKIVGNKLKRDNNYERYNQGAEGLCEYKRAKKQNENKFTTKDNTPTERQLLDRLNNHTFATNSRTDVVVLDIEVCVSGQNGRKCDLILLNTKLNKIMFVEGKVFNDNRVNVEYGRTPKIIDQVKVYTDMIERQKANIEKQYGGHIRIINKIFGTKYNPEVELITPCKLLVYGTPLNPTNANALATIEKVGNALGETNVFWIYGNDEPGIDDIWLNLYKS